MEKNSVALLSFVSIICVTVVYLYHYEVFDRLSLRDRVSREYTENHPQTEHGNAVYLLEDHGRCEY